MTVNEFYISFLISFGTYLLISSHTLFTECFIYYGYLSLMYIFSYFIFKISNFRVIDFLEGLSSSYLLNSFIFFLSCLNFYTINSNRSYSLSFFFVTSFYFSRSLWTRCETSCSYIRITLHRSFYPLSLSSSFS